MTESNRLDLVLVNPGAQHQVYQGLSTASLTAIEPPMWVGILATYMRNQGISVKIIDAEADSLTPDQAGQKVAELNPVLAGVIAFGSQPSASTQKMTATGATSAAIRKHAANTKTIMAGVHVSALPKRTLEEEPIDYVAEGEGHITILELLKVLKSGNQEELKNVRGLWYQENGETKQNAPAPLSDNLDRDFPTMAWDLLPVEKYRAHNWHCFGQLQERQPYGVLYTSLGCPFKCSFCCINAPFGKPSIRYRSPESVIEELEVMSKKYGIKTIKIIDEMFVLHRDHVMGICNLIIERGLDFNFWAYARVDTVRDDMLATMKKAGINWLALGIESGSKHVRDGVSKGRFGQSDIAKVVQKIKDADINIIGNYIFGLPDDDLQSMQDTLDMAVDLNCEFSNFYSAMAYPGSKLYPMAIEKGWALPEQWHGFSQHGVETLPLPTEHLTAGQVLRFRDRAFTHFFTNQKYLDYVEKRFGQQTLEHIKEMASHTVTRKFYDDKPIDLVPAST